LNIVDVEHKSPGGFYNNTEERNIAGEDKSLKVAESLFRASEVVNSGGGGGYGFWRLRGNHRHARLVRDRGFIVQVERKGCRRVFRVDKGFGLS